MVKLEILEISAEEYHARPEVSNTGIGYLLKSPSHYIAWKNQPPESTDAQVFGTAVHLAVLEPDKFYKQVIRKPDGHDGRTKEGKAWVEANRGKIILSAHNFGAVEGIVEAVYAHPAASSMLQAGKCEQSLIWTDEDTGVPCRLRTDYLRDGVGIDLKTTIDASPNDFKRSIANFGYHRQAAFYLDGIKACTGISAAGFALIVVEKEAPFAVSVFVIDEASIQIGRDEYKAALRTYAECIQKDKWPGYPTTIQTISLPEWKFKQVLNGY